MTVAHGVQCIDGLDFQAECEFCEAPLKGRPDFMCAECRAEYICVTRGDRPKIGIVDPPVQFTPAKRGRC